MAEPTNYDLIQDDRLDSLESLITAEYEPPAGAQYSYPVANQGITQDQFNNMMLPMGAGIIHRGYSPYYLTGHESDAETNQRNTLILKVDSSDGFSGSSIAGFYHRLTEDMELPFPPVTTTTDYYVTVTYDPRRFKTDPLRIEVWPGTPPRTHDQQHIILNRVRRQPNQLLSQAEITRYRQAVAPTIFVQNPAQLPAPADVLYGTIAATHSGSMHVSLGSSWLELNAPGTWRPVLRIGSAWETQSARPLRARTVPGGCTLSGVLQPTTGSSGTLSNGARVFDLPTGIVPPFTVDFEVVANSAAIRARFRANEDGTVTALGSITERIGWLSFNAFIPID